MSREKSPTDFLVTYKSVILFTVLTLLNISVFVFMIFENQTELIAKNAELEGRDKGISLKVRVEGVLWRKHIIRKRFNIKSAHAKIYVERDTSLPTIDSVGKGASVFSDFEKDGWNRIVYKKIKAGWIQSKDLTAHIPAWESGELIEEDIRMILDIFEEEGIGVYSIFLENGRALVHSAPERVDDASLEEQRLIKKAIFKNSFESLAFFHQVNKKAKTINLYIPIYYSPNKLFVLKPTLSMNSVWKQTRFLYRQIFIIGILVLLVHAAFVVANQLFIIRPMVKERVTLLAEKNSQIQQAKDRLQKTHDALNEAHSQIQRELNVAREIQLGLIPKKFLSAPGYSFSVKYQPAEKVGGDFYDFYQIDKEHIGMVLADAAGHGIPAAFLVSMAKMAFNTHSKNQLSTATMLTQANAELGPVITTAHYLTAIYAILHLPTGKVTFTRASHPLPLHFQNGKKSSIKELNTSGMFVGMLANANYGEGETQMERGDRLIFFTDGIPEASNPENKIFGSAALRQIIAEQGHLPGEKLIEKVWEKMTHFTRGRKLEDDSTILVLERN